MDKGQYLSALLRSSKTVFTTRDIALLWHEPNTAAARVRLNYYTAKGDLIRLRNGIYAKNPHYSRLELATRILTPAYVSFETVLAREGVIFQYYEPIFVASYVTRQVVIDGQTYAFRMIKPPLLVDAAGIEHSAETSIASRERAFLDMLYVHDDYHFDNLRSLDWEAVFRILPIYTNQRLTRRVNSLYRQQSRSMP